MKDLLEKIYLPIILYDVCAKRYIVFFFRELQNFCGQNASPNCLSLF